MMEVVLKIKMPEGWVRDVSEKFGTPIRFLDCMPSGELGGRGLFQIDTEKADIQNIRRFFRQP